MNEDGNFERSNQRLDCFPCGCVKTIASELEW